MEKFLTWLATITPGDVLSVISMFGAVFAAIYGALTSTKKFEMREAYRQEVLDWYKETARIMIDLIHYLKKGLLYTDDFGLKRLELLCSLSAQIDLGRFYFPNSPFPDWTEKKKPSAYRGKRHFVMDCLVYFYREVENGCDESILPRLQNMQRAYTSVIFDMLDPKRRNKEYVKYANISVPEDKSFFEFMDDPDNHYLYK